MSSPLLAHWFNPLPSCRPSYIGRKFSPKKEKKMMTPKKIAICLIQLHKNEGILQLPLMDTFKSPILWIDTRALILLLMLKSVLWLLEMGIGRPDGMLTRLCLRTIPLHRQRMKNSGSMRPIMLLSVLPFSLLFWAALAVLAPRRRDFCALWPF